jgi:hypothetical protein
VDQLLTHEKECETVHIRANEILVERVHQEKRRREEEFEERKRAKRASNRQDTGKRRRIPRVHYI